MSIATVAAVLSVVENSIVVSLPANSQATKRKVGRPRKLESATRTVPPIIRPMYADSFKADVISSINRHIASVHRELHMDVGAVSDGVNTFDALYRYLRHALGCRETDCGECREADRSI